jgi:uncharacterized small protein (DUF1192 family)
MGAVMKPADPLRATAEKLKELGHRLAVAEKQIDRLEAILQKRIAVQETMTSGFLGRVRRYGESWYHRFQHYGN